MISLQIAKVKNDGYKTAARVKNPANEIIFHQRAAWPYKLRLKGLSKIVQMRYSGHDRSSHMT